jgi:hypothetical protein
VIGDSHTAENDALDREGRWDIRVTIYRNDKRVATCDAGGSVFDFAVQSVVTNLERRDVQMHQPRPRTRVTPPASPERACGLCRRYGHDDDACPSNPATWDIPPGVTP